MGQEEQVFGRKSSSIPRAAEGHGHRGLGLLAWGIGGVAAALGLAWGAVCLIGGATTEAPHGEPLRIAINPWPGYEFATLARAKGFFEDEGVEVRLLELSSLGDCRRAFERGQADGFFGTVTEVLQSREQSDREAMVVLVTDYSAGADVVLGRPGSLGVEDLRGKTVGIENGSINGYVLARALSLHGMSWKDVKVVHVAAADMPDAFASGRVDAVVAYPPVSLKILETGSAVTLFSTSEIPGEVLDLLAIDKSVLSVKAEQTRAFLRAWFRAQEYAVQHPQESYAIMAAREQISPQEFEAAIRDGVRLLFQGDQTDFLGPGGRLESILVTTYDALFHSGQLKSRAPTGSVMASVEDR